MTRSSRLLVPLLLSLAALGAACAPTLHLRLMQPAPYSFGTARHLVLLEAQGPQHGLKLLLEDMELKVRWGHYFTFEDRRRKGSQVVWGARSVRFSERGSPLAEGEIGLRLALSQQATPRKETVFEEKNGKTEHKQVDAGWTVLLVLQVTAIDSQGQVLLSQRYSHEKRTVKPSELESLDFFEISNDFQSDITPYTYSEHVRLDDEEPAQRPILEAAQRGYVSQALEEMQAYVEDNPRSPSARYNLAVLMDALGLHEEALELYDQAIKASPKAFYAETRERCAVRLQYQRELARQGVVPGG